MTFRTVQAAADHPVVDECEHHPLIGMSGWFSSNGGGKADVCALGSLGR